MSVIRFQPVCAADLLSRAIAWWGQGYGGWSHIDCVLPNGQLMGARSDRITYKGRTYPAGLQLRPPNYERWIRRALLTLEVTAAQEHAWIEWLLSEKGDGYDSDAILGFFLGRRLHQEGHWICSAAATGSVRAIHLLPKLPYPDSQITPNSFVLMMCSLGARYIEYPC